MNNTGAGRIPKIINLLDILTIIIVGIFLIIFIYFGKKVPMDALTFVTFMMAVAIWITAMLSFHSNLQTRDMLRLNWQMLEEMRKSRPRPLVTADLEKSNRPTPSIAFSKVKRSIYPSGKTYDLVIKNVGREFARDINVIYCTREIPEPKPGEKPKAYDESELVDSLSIGLKVRPLGPGKDQKFNFDFITSPKILYIKIIKITYSDGVETYQEGPYEIDTWK